MTWNKFKSTCILPVKFMALSPKGDLMGNMVTCLSSPGCAKHHTKKFDFLHQVETGVCLQPTPQESFRANSWCEFDRSPLSDDSLQCIMWWMHRSLAPRLVGRLFPSWQNGWGQKQTGKKGKKKKTFHVIWNSKLGNPCSQSPIDLHFACAPVLVGNTSSNLCLKTISLVNSRTPFFATNVIERLHA